MARKRVTLVMCDICERDDVPASRYIINYPDQQRFVTDLCEDDASALVELRNSLPEPKAAGKRGQRSVVTMDQVAAAKKSAARKRTAKKTAARRPRKRS